jgi:hypothetical protein
MVVEKITEEAAAWRWQVLGACAFCPWGLLVVSPIAGTETGLSFLVSDRLAGALDSVFCRGEREQPAEVRSTATPEQRLVETALGADGDEWSGFRRQH